MISPGTMLNDRYEILNKCSALAIPYTYEAKDHVTNQNVLIKVLKANLSKNKTIAKIFTENGKNIIGLKGPNVIEVLATGQSGDICYTVLEYTKGITLKVYLERKISLMPKEALSIFIQLGLGVQLACSKEQTHVNLKPDTVFITTEGKIKITDICKERYCDWIDEIPGLSREDRRYLYPDRRYAEPNSVQNCLDASEKDEMYSMGVILFEMLTGHNPFENVMEENIPAYYKSKSFAQLSAYAPELPDLLQQIINKCCNTNKSMRYSSVEAMLEEAKYALVNMDKIFKKTVTSAIKKAEPQKPVTSVAKQEGLQKSGKVETTSNTEVQRAYEEPVSLEKIVQIKTDTLLKETLKMVDEFTTDRKLLKAYLSDSIPNDKLLQNNLLNSFDERIPQDIMKLKHITRIDFGRFSMRFSEAYGVTMERSEQIVATWIDAMEISTDIKIVVR